MTGKNPFDLTGKVVLVTGASSGLGRHFALLLAGLGAKLAVAARRTEALDSLAAEIVAAGGTAFATKLDVTDAGMIEDSFDAVAAALGPVDVLVNNSGVSGAAPALDLEEADWDKVLDTNLKGAWLVARAFARRARADKRPGVVVNIASILADRVTSHLSAYAASKAGLVQLTRAMALEWARHGIRVNAIAPGYVETDINRDFFQTEAGKAMIARIPQRRLGQPGDLDGALLLLASDASRFMTGSVVTVDGGHVVGSL